ncbi:hypothetical protein HZH66_013486 [Vespula vulgaris]|uniref:Uncharacterized protein n=1 Tax=Vespula vulgaris TaxID=7454 RepID=A0A834MSI3_VESVU|nr:hypothetical protein HZH66_013486 [Vespula vulgaris]
MPDSLPNSPTKEPPVGGSDLTVPGTFVNSSLTVSRKNCKKGSEESRENPIPQCTHAKIHAIGYGEKRFAGITHGYDDPFLTAKPKGSYQLPLIDGS